MFVFVSWFATAPVPQAEVRARRRRVQQQLDLLGPASWQESDWSGAGWDTVVREAQPGPWRWRFAQRRGNLAAVSVGFPLGGRDVVPTDLGRRLLDGEDVHRELAAPLGLVSVDESAGRMAVQQDWHGMGQVFRLETDTGVAFSNRPSLLPLLFDERPRPQVRGWSLYLASGSFAGDSSPVRGVHLLHPGERVSGHRDRKGVWKLHSQRRFALDDIVAEAVATRPPLEDIAMSVVDATQRVVRSLTMLWPHPLRMGLSGGKDSRLLAAALVDADLVTGFRTNEDLPAEGEVARRLREILEQAKGQRFEHEMHVASESERVLSHGLLERAARLQRRHDFMFRSTYLNRPLHDPFLDTLPHPAILGVCGEYLSDFWLPARWHETPEVATPARARRALRRRLTSALPPASLRPRATRHVDAWVDKVVDRAVGHGLAPFAAVSYGYMSGRIRRAPSSLSNVHQTMPLAVPETVRASMQLSPEQKLRRSLHHFVIDRLMPGWSEVPFVSGGAVRDAAQVRVWHGDGLRRLTELVAAPAGTIDDLVRRPAVEAALERVRSGAATRGDHALLRQFTMASVADRELSPRG